MLLSADRLATDKAVSSTAFRITSGTIHAGNNMDIEDLKLHYAYDPITGLFTHIKPRTPRIKAGAVVRTLVNGYVSIKHKGKRYYAHRVAYAFMTGHPPEECVDHINGDKADNRWSNLRAATYSQNNQNAKTRSHNVSGLKGVKFNKRRGVYYASIVVKGLYKYLGTFSNAEAAHEAYKTAADIHFGEFANHG